MTNHSHKHRPLVMSSPKQRQGSYFEQQASQFLQGHGLIFIAKNWQQPKVGEIDLVMLEVGQAWSTLVFIEVRQRRRSSFGNAALSVTKAKQRKIINTAKYFCSSILSMQIMNAGLMSLLMILLVTTPMLLLKVKTLIMRARRIA